MQYTPLEPGNNEFRLLTLRSRSFSRRSEGTSSASVPPLICELRVESRSYDPEYKALSYTWGSPDDTLSIFINGVEFQKSRNLCTALEHIREEATDVVIWIDAICIDQRNSKEKDEQVVLMKEIYANASETIVWLGPAEENSDSTIQDIGSIGEYTIEKGAFDLLLELGQPGHSLEEIKTIKQSINTAISDVMDVWLEDMDRVMLLYRSYVRLLERDYWKRVWILQEFIVSREVRILCGNKSLPYPALHAAVMFMAYLRMYAAQRSASLTRSEAGWTGVTTHGLLIIEMAKYNIPRSVPVLMALRKSHYEGSTRQASYGTSFMGARYYPHWTVTQGYSGRRPNLLIAWACGRCE